MFMLSSQRRESEADARRRALLLLAIAATLVALVGGTYFSLGAGGVEPLPVVERRIDINEADRATLQLLPGIGRTIAERVVEAREAGDPFRGPDDLRQRVRGIGPKTAEGVVPYVTFDEE